MADPLATENDLQAHEADCPSCAPFARDMRTQELELRRLLHSATPPQGMTERIQLAGRLDQRATSQRRWWYSAAAAVLLAVGASMVSLWTTSVEREQETLAQSVLNHIEDEAVHLRAAGPASSGRVKWVFQRFGAQLADNIGPVNFAAECLMRHRTGVHLVMPGKTGPITVFYMPGEMIDDVVPISSARFAGQIVPTSWGSVAVVGEKGEPLEGMGARLAEAVQWPQAAAAVSDAGSGLVGTDILAALRIAQPKQG
jgi:hypothetical protein